MFAEVPGKQVAGLSEETEMSATSTVHSLHRQVE